MGLSICATLGGTISYGDLPLRDDLFLPATGYHCDIVTNTRPPAATTPSEATARFPIVCRLGLSTRLMMIAAAASAAILLSFRLRPMRPSLRKRDLSHVTELFLSLPTSLSFPRCTVSLLSRWMVQGMNFVSGRSEAKNCGMTMDGNTR